MCVCVCVCVIILGGFFFNIFILIYTQKLNK